MPHYTDLRETQCKKPSGLLGRFTLWRMNSSHSKLTDWGLSHFAIPKHFTILDAGCGGGRTISKLAALATEGKVHGIDYSEASVAASLSYNARAIRSGRVEIREASVSQLPFPANTFDLVTAVETHFWWPSLSRDLCEILRVLKPGATLILIAKVYKGAASAMSRLCEKYAPFTGMIMLTPDEHRHLLATAGFSSVTIDTLPEKGWLTALAQKPS